MTGWTADASKYAVPCNARTYAHAPVRRDACVLACGTGSCIFYSRLTCASQRSLRISFFFFIISPAGIFSQLRDHVIRASRAKFPLVATFADFVFLGDVRFLNIDAPRVRRMQNSNAPKIYSKTYLKSFEHSTAIQALRFEPKFWHCRYIFFFLFYDLKNGWLYHRENLLQISEQNFKYAVIIKIWDEYKIKNCELKNIFL